MNTGPRTVATPGRARPLPGRRRVLVLCSVLALISSAERRGWAAPKVSAEDEAKEKARALYREAKADAEAGHCAVALGKYRRVMQFKATASVVYHLAVCEQTLGQMAAAWTDVMTARELAVHDDVADVLPLADELIRTLEPAVPRFILDVAPREAGEQVYLDETPVPESKWGRPIALEPGNHVVTAEAPNRARFRATEKAAIGAEVRVSVRLPPGPAEAVGANTAAGRPAFATGAMPADDSGTTPSHVALDETSQAKHETVGSRSSSAPIWATVGAVGLAGLGVGAFFVAGSDARGFANNCQAGTTPCPGDVTTVRALDYTALGAWIGAATLTGAAIFLWTRKEHAPTAAFVLRPNQLTIEGAF